jgi:replication factor A1
MQGDSIYAEIPPDAIPFLQPHLEEGKIIILTKVTVDIAKPGFKVVQNPYMIKLNRRTQIIEATNPPPDFPKYTFSLIPFDKLSDYTKKN